jgi:integrase
LLPGLSSRYPDFAYRVLTVLAEGLPERQGGCSHAEEKDQQAQRDELQCPPGKDREFFWDDAIAGFGVAAFPSGKKVYVAQYRQAGRSRRATIGEHGRLTPDEARSEAKKLLGVVEAGSDPIAERHKERAVRTFGAVAEEFLARHVAAKRKGRTADEYRRILQSRIMPAIGSKRIVDVRRADVAKLHGKLDATPYEANRVLALVSAVWNWAARHDEVPLADNPAKGIERYREHKRERYLTSEELGRLGDVLREGETNGLPWQGNYESKHTPKEENRRTVLDPFAVAAIRLLVLTDARLREILHAKWEQVDFERGVISPPTPRAAARRSISARRRWKCLPACHGSKTIRISLLALTTALRGRTLRSLGGPSQGPLVYLASGSMICGIPLHPLALARRLACRSSESC